MTYAVFDNNPPTPIANEPTVREPETTRENETLLAGFYALYLRGVEGYSAEEARVLVKRRYPRVRLPEIPKRAEVDW